MATAAPGLGVLLDSRTAPGELYEPLADGRLRCLACGHRCVIFPGHRGICKVRFNDAGTLRVPWGYVAALQCDPTEKKPFYHVLPGSKTLTFGMLGCDLHCPYCFTPDTRVVTDRGVLPLDEVFARNRRVLSTPRGEVARPTGLRAVTASGHLRPVVQVFRHRYAGKIITITPYYLPAIRCTPEHGMYATTDPGQPPTELEAARLTERHFLAVPRRYQFSSPQAVDVREALAGHTAEFKTPHTVPAAKARRKMVTTEDYHLVPIRSIKTLDYEGDVFNMEVEGEHNYLANFALVANCQNWLTSQALRDPVAGTTPDDVTPGQLVTLAQRSGAQLVGSSYNEPLITAEWAVAVFKEAQRAGLRTCFISNGNATREVLTYLRPWCDAYKIDLKGMTQKGYRQLGGVLERVLETIKMVHEMGFWMEIVTLVIPGWNDSDDELAAAAGFIASVSKDIPWHVTAFHPDYRMTDRDATSVQTLMRAARIGKAAGLHYVYAGNAPGRVGDLEHTFCRGCGAVLIERWGFLVQRNRLAATAGRCPDCAYAVPGIWT